MNEVTLPPSPNWYLNNILACAIDGTVAWGARSVIVIAKTENESKNLNYSIIDKAHKERVTSLAFSPTKEHETLYLVSSGDDNFIKIWNLNDSNKEFKCFKLDSNLKVIGVDWSKYNQSLVCFVSENGVLVTWNIDYDVKQVINLGKLTATCIACCPHNGNIVSIGSKSGLVYIVDIRGNGNIMYKLRGHDEEIVSLSWCPSPGNIFEEKNDKELLLASGAKDRLVFLWKAGSDGRFQTQINFPAAPLDSSNHRNKVSASAGNFTAVYWLEPTTLLTSSPWGELLLWDLTNSEKKKLSPKLIHAKHGKGLFCIAALSDFPKQHNNIEPSKDSEQSKDIENENWRRKINVKTIWTLAQDRQVICCSISNSEPSIDYTIPTQGGFVYCTSACPVDTSQIAFGVGDAMIRLWNLSEPHESIIELKMLWDKIKGQVRALSWHPVKENLLAFATNEGRVGIFDTNINKPPILCKQYHRDIVYSIGWGPAPNVKEYALYTCSNKELVYYNQDKINDKPVSATKKKDCMEFSWKPDYSLIALGFLDGSISFLNNELKECGQTIHVLNKAVQCMTWHPESTSSDLNISSMQGYLAVAINGTTITVFEIFNKNKLEENESDESSFYRTVATLNAHSEKVVCLAWSPHISGYLVSGSYDSTAQVWKVDTQEVIATFTGHVGPVQCCMWSPFSQDLIMTGSFDFTLRIWSVSKQNIVLKTSSSGKISTKGKRTKKKKTKNNDATKEIDIDLNEELNELKITVKDENQDTNQNVSHMTKKKKPKKITHFPGYAEMSKDNKRWCYSIKALINILENNSVYDELAECHMNEIDSNEKKTGNSKVPILFGDKKHLVDALCNEKSILASHGQQNIVTEINLWSGNLKENLEEAVKTKSLSDFLVSLAPTISLQTWEKMCEAYAAQLLFEENPHKAVSYLLCINKVHEAIDVFITAKLYKEAYVLASSKLDSEDPTIKSILIEWANNARKDGNFQNATECYLKLGEYAKAAKILEKRQDFDSLNLAIDLAELCNDFDLSASLKDKAITQALLNSEVSAAKLIIEKFAQVQCRDIEVEIFGQLSEIFKDINDQMIFNWLKGESSITLLETLGNQFSPCQKKYSLLLQKDMCLQSTSDKMVQINVSHQLALSILADQQTQRLKHIVKAFDIITQYINESESTENKSFILMEYIITFDNQNILSSKSIFNSDENKITQSLRAYLCHAVTRWFLECKLPDSEMTKCANLIIVILEKCIQDLFNKVSLSFWTMGNEINKLEAQLSSALGNLQKAEENEVIETKGIIEHLEQLKNSRKQFLETYISMPNPLSSYGIITEFISKLPDGEIKQKVTELVMDTWKRSISLTH